MKFNKLIPELSVSNYEKSLNFYTNILGFTIEYTREEDKFALLSVEGSQIMIEEVNGNWSEGNLEHPYGRGINFQIELSSLEPLLNSLKKQNRTLFVDVQEKWYGKNDTLLGQKEFLIQDPDGYLLRFFESIGAKEE